MKSIFTKISLWAIVTTVLSLAGFALTTRIIWESLPGPFDVIPRFHQVLLEDARSIYEQGGREALKRYLDRLDRRFEAKHSLVDPDGRDLVDGSDRTEELGRAGPPGEPPRQHGNALYLASPPTGSRLLIEILPKIRPEVFLGYYLWIFMLIVAMGWALAISLARPLLALRRVVERFGKGDLSIRSGMTRGDEIGELARAFDLMAERTETLMTAQRRLLEDVSHELRSPLARLQLTVRLARTSEDREVSLDRIKKEVDRLSSLVGELLQVAAAEDDPQARNQEEVRLDDLVTTLVEDVALEAEARRCRFVVVENQPTIILGDRELLRRALENVLRNAVRYAPDDSSIRIESRQEAGVATICVRDFGTGVPEEAVSEIFRPFYRVGGDRSRAGGGVGLGLSITRRAVELHGGEIVARNEDPGLRVTIRLPATRASAEPRDRAGEIAAHAKGH